MTDFEKMYKNEKNDKTALILMLSVISEKLIEIITLLKDTKENAKDKKFYLPITIADYD